MTTMCCAPDGCVVEAVWSGRCKEHYWRMVAGQEPSIPSRAGMFEQGLGAEPENWYCRSCGLRLDKTPSTKDYFEARNHASDCALWMGLSSEPAERGAA